MGPGSRLCQSSSLSTRTLRIRQRPLQSLQRIDHPRQLIQLSLPRRREYTRGPTLWEQIPQRSREISNTNTKFIARTDAIESLHIHYAKIKFGKGEREEELDQEYPSQLSLKMLHLWGGRATGWKTWSEFEATRNLSQKHQFRTISMPDMTKLTNAVMQCFSNANVESWPTLEDERAIWIQKQNETTLREYGLVPRQT